jgi:hypothetical protein
MEVDTDKPTAGLDRQWPMLIPYDRVVDTRMVTDVQRNVFVNRPAASASASGGRNAASYVYKELILTQEPAS